VRIMTTGTVRRSNWIVHMLLGENRPVGRVASGAESVNLVFQQIFALRGSVGFMACQASLFDRIVFVLELGKLISHFLVTIETERIPGLEQIVLIAGRVGIMALHAIPFSDNLVGADTGGCNYFTMAREADFFGVTLQKLTM